MAKTKDTPEEDLHPHEILRQNLKRTNKTVTKYGKVKKKILKQFTEYQCSICKKKFKNKSSLAKHKNSTHSTEEHPCSSCDYIGKNKQYLRRHWKKVHTAATHECKVCGRAFHHPCILREHSMIHTGEKPLKCEVCGKSFRVIFSLNTHMLIHKNEKPYKCSFCEYACRDSSTLRKHEYRHMGVVRTFPCKVCKKKFNSKPILKQHISETHLEHLEIDAKRFPCEHCEKIFKQRSSLTKHVDLVHRSSAVPCPICGQSLKHANYLRRHLLTHFPERPHVCAREGCGRAFKDKGDLQKHSIIHDPEKHHACNTCGAKFVRAARLVAHMATHRSREKTLECDYCRDRFYTKNYLIKHIKQKHTDRQRYICDHCGLVTFNKPSIVMHLKYGRCKKEDLRCKICKTSYKHLNYLRSHFLKTHKMRYRPRKLKKKKKCQEAPSVKIKEEPVDPYEEVKISLLRVDKDEVVVDAEDPENDLIPYSKQVLSEDLQELLCEPVQELPEQTFDQFLIRHVFNTEVKEEPQQKIKVITTDEDQAASVAQKVKYYLEKAKKDERKKKIQKKKKEAKLFQNKVEGKTRDLPRKRQREKSESEKVEQMHATTDASVEESGNKIKNHTQIISKDVIIENVDKHNDAAQNNNFKHREDSIKTSEIKKPTDLKTIIYKNIDNDTKSKNKQFSTEQNTEKDYKLLNISRSNVKIIKNYSDGIENEKNGEEIEKWESASSDRNISTVAENYSNNEFKIMNDIQNNNNTRDSNEDYNDKRDSKNYGHDFTKNVENISNDNFENVENISNDNFENVENISNDIFENHEQNPRFDKGIENEKHDTTNMEFVDDKKNEINYVFSCDFRNKTNSNFEKLNDAIHIDDVTKKDEKNDDDDDDEKIYGSKKDCETNFDDVYDKKCGDKSMSNNFKQIGGNIQKRQAVAQCDEELQKFYENHIRGTNIDFGQFLKIFKNMDSDTYDAESSKTDEQIEIMKVSENTEKTTDNTSISNYNKALNKSQIIASKSIKQSVDKTVTGSSKSIQPSDIKKPYKRVIMISKKMHLQREKAKMLMREKLKNNKL